MIEISKKRIMYIFCEITKNCNLDCLYCYIKDNVYGPKASLVLRNLTNIINGPYKSYHISLSWTGGEPTLRPDIVIDLAPNFKEIGVELNLCTNGTTLKNPDIILALIKYYSKITVSIDVPNGEDSLRSGDALDIWDGVWNLISERGKENYPIVSIATTLSKMNIDYFEDICKKAISYHVDRIEFRPLQCGLDDEEKIRYTLNANDIHKIEAIKEIRDKYKGDIFIDGSDVYIRNIVHLITGVIDMRSQIYNCLAGRSILFIDANFRIFPCCSFFPKNKYLSFKEIINKTDGEIAKQIRTLIIDSQPNNCVRCLDMANMNIQQKFLENQNVDTPFLRNPRNAEFWNLIKGKRNTLNL